MNAGVVDQEVQLLAESRGMGYVLEGPRIPRQTRAYGAREWPPVSPVFPSVYPPPTWLLRH